MRNNYKPKNSEKQKTIFSRPNQCPIKTNMQTKTEAATPAPPLH